jgi:Tfp pilus assembly protein PilF
MSDKPDCRQAPAPGGKSRRMQRGILGAVCVLVIGVYAYMTQLGVLELLGRNAGDAYYNLLVQGFRAGQLNLKRDVPPGLAQLADPYDPIANFPYRCDDRYPLGDVSYYNGKLYLYFGVTPALILFWPYAALTGHYLFHWQAVTIFCAIGYLASVGLLRALWRRYFTEVSVGVVATCALALGLATGAPVLLSRSEVPISCGRMLTMLALGAIWCAMHEPERRRRWLTIASVAYGMALGARPSLLFGAVILLVPVAQAWRERRQIWPLLMAATGPILVIGLGLMLYNVLRFDNPLEFGQRYQLAEVRQDTMQHFSLHYFWFNFRLYFLEPARWSGRFPFVHDLAVPPTPSSHGRFGVLTNIPLVWLALAVPLAWRGRLGKAGSILREFLTTVALFYGICAVTLCLYYYVAIRFRMELLPALVLLAVVGILGLERALAARPVWRCTVRWGWGLLLGVSVAFTPFTSVEQLAETHYNLGVISARLGKLPESIEHYERALSIYPSDAKVHNNLGIALAQAGRINEAIEQFEQALRINPDLAEVHGNLGHALMLTGRASEAVGHWKRALQIKPDWADVHYDLGLALEQMDKVGDAIEQYRLALKFKPDMVEAQERLARLRVGR